MHFQNIIVKPIRFIKCSCTYFCRSTNKLINNPPGWIMDVWGLLDVPGAGCPRVLDVWVLDVPGVRCPRVLDVWVLGVSMLDVPMLDVFEPPPVGPHPHLPQKHTCTCFCRSSRCKESVRCVSSSPSTWTKYKIEWLSFPLCTLYNSIRIKFVSY